MWGRRELWWRFERGRGKLLSAWGGFGGRVDYQVAALAYALAAGAYALSVC